MIGHVHGSLHLNNIPLLIVTPSASEDYELKQGQTVTAFPRLLLHELLREWVI